MFNKENLLKIITTKTRTTSSILLPGQADGMLFLTCCKP